DRKTVGTRKSAPHQHSRHAKCRVGDMARQAIILTPEEREDRQTHRPLLKSGDALIERIEDYSLLGVLRRKLHEPSMHPPDDYRVVEEKRARIAPADPRRLNACLR